MCVGTAVVAALGAECVRGGGVVVAGGAGAAPRVKKSGTVCARERA